MDSAFLLQQKLEKANQEIETLRSLVGQVCAIIITQGGEVVVENSLIERRSEMEWSVVNEQGKRTFMAWMK